MKKRRLIPSVCEYCKKPFLGRSDTPRRFCSRDCTRHGKFSRVTLICAICEKPFLVTFARKTVAKFCSRKCQGKHLSSKTGELNATWKGGTIIRKNGYRCVRVDGEYIYEHRHVVESLLGRKLSKSEVVHHLDGDRLNNAIDNLEVMSKREHDRLETIKRHKSGFRKMSE